MYFFKFWCHDIQPNGTQHGGAEHNKTQHKIALYNGAEHNTS
jgi:hypothetical protein